MKTMRLSVDYSPAVTVGMSVHNAGKYLRPALQSVLAQTFQDWELVLVDDGSNDGNADWINDIGDPRVRVLRDGSRRGLAARLNQIVHLARGKYFARMDADDMLDPTRLEKQVSYLEQHPDVDLVGCGLVIINNENGPMGRRAIQIEHEEICVDPLRGIGLGHATITGRMEWFREHPYNELNRCCEDWELWFHSYQTSRFANLPEPLYYYREYFSFSIRKYIRAKLKVAQLEWQHRQQFGVFRTAYVCAGQFLRILANSVASCCGLNYYIVRRRSAPIDSRTALRVEAAIKRDLAFVLPASASHPTTELSPAFTTCLSPSTRWNTIS